MVLRQTLSEMLQHILLPNRPHVKFWLHVGLNLESLLQVVKGGVFEAWVADEVVKLVASFYDVHVQYVLWAYYVLFFQDSNIPVDV
jgi:hypothetical protein